MSVPAAPRPPDTWFKFDVWRASRTDDSTRWSTGVSPSLADELLELFDAVSSTLAWEAGPPVR
jgi:hypothetical protein